MEKGNMVKLTENIDVSPGISSGETVLRKGTVGKVEVIEKDGFGIRLPEGVYYLTESEFEKI